MEKAYILNLKFGTTQWQVWFSGEDNAETEKKWASTLKSLELIGDNCSNSRDFFEKAVAHFKDAGFVRIAK